MELKRPQTPIKTVVEPDPPPPLQPSEVVKLNVGGVIFQTMTTTLTGWRNQKNNFFSGLLLATNGEETPFIDRDPDYFRAILNYLRTGQLACSGLSQSQLRIELAFYGLPEPAGWSSISVGFQQWAQGHFGECREFIVEDDEDLRGAIVYRGQAVWMEGVGWRDPFSSFGAAEGRENARSILFSEMGKFGWELKAFTYRETKHQFHALLQKR